VTNKLSVCGLILSQFLVALILEISGGDLRVAAAGSDTPTLGPAGPSPTATAIPVAPTLTPPGPAQPSICDLPLQSAPGGSLVTFGNIELTLPGTGEYVIQPVIVEGGQNRLSICYRQGRATITLNAVDGRELTRSAPDAASSAILDRIVESVRVSSTSNPAVRPPSTGGAGLK